jgi:nucleotide-binding universal stress UspA family protein
MKIIVLTDFSKTADKALEYAKIIAQKNTDEIVLFHNINAFLSEYAAAQIFDADYQWQSSVNNQLIDTIIEEKRKTVADILKKQTDKICKEGFKATFQIGLDFDVVDMVAHFDENKADLIVMGAHGEGKSWVDKLIGNTAALVIRKSPVPVIAVPHNAELRNPHKVGISIDIKGEKKSIDYIQSVLKFIPAAKEKFILNVSTPGYFSTTEEFLIGTEEIDEVFEDKDFEYQHINDDTVEKGIYFAADLFEMDLITFHSHSYRKLFSHSVTENILNEIKIPVLSIKLDD